MLRLAQVKARVQPVLEQDFDALYAEFIEETGERDLARFLDHLKEYGLISPEVHAAASAPPPLEPEDLDENESTVVIGHDMAEEIEKAMAAVVQGAEDSVPPPLQPMQTLPGSFGEEEDALVEADPTATLDGFLDTPSPPRRTMFRRLTGGELKETGVQELEERTRRRRRRSDEGAPRRRQAAKGPQDDERYVFLGTVGEGAMGRVHLAQDLTLHRKVAYKAMSEDIAEQATLASKFTAEAQITAQLDHPNIVPVYALEGEAAYTMKLIQGRTLQDLIHETRALYEKRSPLEGDHSLQSRLELFLRVCDAMAYAHNRGVVHRDLKPENIMVGAFGELYVMDWGIARLMQGEFEDKVEIGADVEDEGDLVIGTPGYMSPEQAEGLNEQLDGRSDQYALGLILFELVALKPAVTGKAPLKIVMRHQDGEKDPLVHAFGDAIPQEIAAIIHKATRKDPDQRYENVRALGDDVRRYLRGEAVLARPDGPLQALLRWMGRHRELTLAAVVLAVTFSTMLVMTISVYTQFALAAQRSREQQLSNLLTMVARQSSLIDGQFLKYEGLLSVIATAATDHLQNPSYDNGGVVYLARDYGDPARQPSGLVESSRYGMPVSLRRSAFLVAGDAQDNRLRGDMLRLAPLDKHFYRVLLRSHSEQAATYTPKRAERALAEVGVPVSWAYVGLENGVFTAFPGHGGFPEGFDHRESPWYKLARDRRGPTWGAPSLDVTGNNLVLTCAQSLYTEDDQVLGVAGIDVTFDYIISELLEAPEFKDAEDVEAFLLDPEGRIAVRSSKKGLEVRANALRNRTIRMPEFHHADVVQAIKERRSGHLQARGPKGRELVVYNRMHSIGWYYVVAGDIDELLSRGG